MGSHYVDFTFAFDTTLIHLEMSDIWPEYVAHAFLSPPPGIVKNIADKGKVKMSKMRDFNISVKYLIFFIC